MWRRLIYHPDINYALRQTLVLCLPVAVGLMLGELRFGLLFSLVPACCNIAGLDTPHKRFFKRLIIGASLFATCSLLTQLLLAKDVPLPFLLTGLTLVLGVTAELGPLHAKLLPASLLAAIFTLSLAGYMPVWEPLLIYALGTLWYGLFNWFWFWIWREQPLRESLSLLYRELADYCEAKYSLLTQHTDPEKALPPLLVAFYGLVFVLAAFVPREFLAVAFDSGGVTTGPMTVPFIMALGVGVSAIRGDRHAADDSFGLVALCSVGPILAVLILGIAFRASDSTYIPPVLPEVSDSVELWQLFHEGLPEYIKEIASSLLPIVVMFGVFQAVALRLDKRTLGRIAVGLAYTYVGLVLFLTGANVGFMPAGNYLGQVLAGCGMPWVIIPIGMLIGYFIVKAEPAVYVLNKQVEEVTDGAISAQAMGMALSAGVSISVGLAMVRVLTGISILWFLIPGYAVAIGISFVVPKLFTAIAFDAGGVASGPMTATFLLPLAQGACVAVGGNIVTDAFGVVAMVAMTPLITVQLMGLAAQLKTGRRRAARAAEPALAGVAAYADWPDDDIIEL